MIGERTATRRAVGQTSPSRVDDGATESASRRLSWQAQVLAIIVLVQGSLLSWALVAQHRAFNSNGWDLGWFDQVVWNSSHGRWFENSFASWTFLGEHVEPVLLFFALLYRIKADVEILLLTQSIVAVAAAVPLYIGAERLLRSKTAALLVAAAFLIAPQFDNAVLFDFHPEVMGVACVFGSFALLATGRPGWAVAAALGAFLLKEDAALVAMGLAWLFWLFGHRPQALALVAISFVYFVFATGYVMPHARDGRDGGPQARWSYLGDSGTAIVRGAVTHPRLVFDHLTETAPRKGVSGLVASQALLPLLGPAAPIALPLTVAHLLSTHEEEARLTLHYGVLPFALVLVASVMSISWLATTRRLEGLWRRLGIEKRSRVVALAGVLLTCELVAAFFSGPFGLRFSAEHYRQRPNAEAVRRAISIIPAGASVGAQSGIVPHVSQRKQVWEFPPAFKARYVIVDLRSWHEAHGPPGPELDYDLAVEALPQTGYCLLFNEDGVQVWTLDSCSGVGASAQTPPASVEDGVTR